MEMPNPNVPTRPAPEPTICRLHAPFCREVEREARNLARPKRFEPLTPRFVEGRGPIVNAVADQQLSDQAIDLSH
jgi:hypothetical protein